MIVINLNSQLGNQMFQYALYRKLQFLGRKVKFDARYYQSKPEQFGLDLFNLKLDFATEKEIYKARDEYRSYPDRIRRKFFGKKSRVFEEVSSPNLCYKPKVFDLKNGYVDGYWQSEKYFIDIRSNLLKAFAFPKIYDDNNLDLLKIIKENVSVSIHIRRGDYLNGFPLMTKEYYHNAINYFNKKYGQVYFVVFSNDIVWAKENLQFDNGVFVEWNNGKDSWKDMYLMTQCKHNIIANSSFSWWGAWLNQNTDKEVITPSIWFYHQETPDVYCDGWKIMNI